MRSYSLRIATCAALAASSVSAQEQPVSLAGRRVRVHEVTHRAPHVGRLLEHRRDSLVLALDAGDRRAVATADLRRLEVEAARSQLRGAGSGMLTGAVVGVFAGALVRVWNEVLLDPALRSGDSRLSMPAFVAVGAAAGAVVGALVGRKPWREVPLAQVAAPSASMP